MTAPVAADATHGRVRPEQAGMKIAGEDVLGEEAICNQRSGPEVYTTETRAAGTGTVMRYGRLKRARRPGHCWGLGRLGVFSSNAKTEQINDLTIR